MPILKTKLLFLFVLFHVAVHAQQYNSTATLNSVKQTGFYQIAVTPPLSSLAKLDLSDLRIMDDKKRQIPYVIIAPQPSFSKTSYQKLTIQQYEKTDSGQSLLVIDNPTLESIYAIALLIKNTSASRVAFISGSDDNNNWFTVAENVLLEPHTSADKDRFVQILRFPKSSYRYIKIRLRNGANDPLNILEAGRYFSVQSSADYPFLVNPGFAFNQTDSANQHSYINVEHVEAYPINRVIVKVKGPPFFKRQVTITTSNNQVNQFEITDSVSVFYLPQVKTNRLVMDINNGDNLPLTITSVTTEQIQKKLITYLVADQSYSLHFNDSTAVAPQYDLAYFKDSLPENIPTLQFGAITTIIKPNQSSANWLWPAIIGAIVVLGGLTFKLTKEFQQKQ